MKIYKITSTRPLIGGTTLPGRSQSHDGILWTLYKSGKLSDEPSTKDQESEIWNFAVNRAKREKDGNTYPFAFINVPEEGIDYFESSSNDEQRHAKKMKSLIDFALNHNQISRFETNPITGDKTQVNKSLVVGANMFLLEDLTQKESEEFFNQRAKNKARAIIDEIFEVCLAENDKTKLMNVAYGIGIDKPFEKSQMQLYNSVISKIDANPADFVNFMTRKEQAVYLAVVKGLKGINELEKPVITMDSENRMFLGDTYLGTDIHEAVGYMVANENVYEYLKKQIKTKEGSENTGKSDDIDKKIAEAVSFLSQKDEKMAEKSLEKVAMPSSQEERVVLDDTQKTINGWLEKFAGAKNPTEMAKIAKKFEYVFSTTIPSENRIKFLEKMEAMAENANVKIEITAATRQLAHE